MDPSNPPFESSSSFGSSGSELEVVRLRRSVNLALAALFLLALGVNLFLFYQWNVVRKDLALLAPQVRQMVGDFEKIELPTYQAFISNLHLFARNNPDFAPVLVKYGFQKTN